MNGFASFLAYGAIGVGLALAILAYRLLSQEQKLKSPRRMFINSVYVFMVFSLILSAGGL
jgi:heme O synthase-like polyprenyltransferase